MDDIYDNLENYDDVNVIEELKTENNALKLQIEKYAKILDQLQKDFDKLSSEYKKLEINYSSLLKTARAEIERKAHLIKTLNTEKDMLIIKSFKKRGVNILKSHRSNFNERQQSKHRDTDSDKSYERQSRVDSTDINNRLNNPSVDTISNASTENKSISSDDKVLKNFQNNESYTNNEEDNVPKNSDEEAQKRLVNKKIKSRRKSMPAARFHNKNCSSEEDMERVNLENIRKPPETNKRYDIRDYRTSTRRYHESKDSGRHSNCSDYKKSKHSDKYNPLHHFQNCHSRDRHDSESTLSYNSRKYKKRELRSPPPDRYKRSKSRDRRKHKRHAKDRHAHHDDSPNYKHKIQNDLDEPSSKRQKIDESSTIEKEKELCDRIHPEEFSCQSPDYLYDAHFTHHLVKEIMNTDATHLEDPRILSTKYILQTHKDKQCLSTVVGRNVNLKLLDISAWRLEVCFSDALKIKPSIEKESKENKERIVSRDLINEIYMDIENTELNDLVESGEVVDDVVDLYTEKTSNHNSIVIAQNVFDVPNPILDSNEAQKSLSSKYTIPKIKKPEKMTEQPEIVADESQNPSAKENDKMNVKTISQELNSTWDGTSENDNQNKPLQIINEISVSTDKLENVDNYKHSKPIIDKSIEDILATVKGDLELSDEENVIDLQKQNVEKHARKPLKNKIDKETDKKLKNNKEKETHKHLKIKISKETCQQITVTSPDKTHIDSSNNESKSSCTITSEETVAKEYLKGDCTSTKESRDSKKRKTKKKLDSKETCKPKESNVEEAISTQAKYPEPSICKPNINKFSDLFGDSSSLITLHDLGIPISNKLLPDAKFPCIYENTEDAVDLSVEDITKIQGSGKVTTFGTDMNLSKDETNVHEKVLNPPDKNDTETNSHIYENIKPELSMDAPNIVKTVIISTGVQPKSLSGTSDSVATVTKDSLQGLEALATSTPNKTNNIPHINGTSTTKDMSSSINNSESQAETDVPDVRIFVRRRRKTIKKT